MGFIKNLKEIINPPSLSKPHFYKYESGSEKQLEKLQEFYKTAPANLKARIEQDIKMLSYGISGEKNVAFELNNSYIPMIVLHDLYLEYEGLKTQIDFLIITKKIVLIIECKNLIGNIEVTSNGDFIRTTKYKGKYKKEGIYSPITQLARHLKMIKRIRFASQKNILYKTLFEQNFNDNYKSIVVLANPKTIVNMKYAKKEVKEKIIRCDQLVQHIKNLLNEKKYEIFSTEKEMYEFANFFLSFHKANDVDYLKKYSIEKPNNNDIEPEPEPEPEQNTPNKDSIYNDLKRFRFEISKSEGIKPYYVFTNTQMDNLIAVMPKTIDELKQISGFGEIKCQKYGKRVLDIIKSHS